MPKPRFASPEEARAYWRESSRRRIRRLMETDPERLRAERARYTARYFKPKVYLGPRVATCRKCGVLFSPPNRGHWSHCPNCRLATCNGCGVRFLPSHGRQQRRRGNKRYHSQECYFDYLANRTRTRKVRDPRMYKSCRIRVSDCRECGTLVTLHGGHHFCSDACRTRHSNRYYRDYQRKTRQTAIRYWRFADTPEAKQLAADYFLLRMELRYGPNQSRWRPDYDRAESRTAEHH